MIGNLYFATFIKIIPIIYLIYNLNCHKSNDKIKQKFILDVRTALIFSAIGDIFIAFIHEYPNSLCWGTIFFAAVSFYS